MFGKKKKLYPLPDPPDPALLEIIMRLDLIILHLQNQIDQNSTTNKRLNDITNAIENLEGSSDNTELANYILENIHKAVQSRGWKKGEGNGPVSPEEEDTEIRM